MLQFKRPSGTSRGVLTSKETWFIHLETDGKKGVGECGILRSLSVDDRDDYEATLAWVCKNIHLGLEVLLTKLIEFPSIQFGLETAFKSLLSDSPFQLFPSDFTNGKASIPINGLIWMGDELFMKTQIEEKLKSGFNCIKMKIGAIDFDAELKLLKSIRESFSASEIELRVDANGAFTFNEALDKLERLSEFDLHSIEQPIKAGNLEQMARLCEATPLDIALDEELIGAFTTVAKNKIMNIVKPQYIILKPSLIGGFIGSDTWIDLAKNNNVGWWITSALESNVGLNAIAQYTYLLNSKMPQGLGTGGLYTNNFDSPLQVKNGTLQYCKTNKWNYNF